MIPTAEQQAIIESCPFCGAVAHWLEKDMNFGTGASGMEPPMRALGCINKICVINPHTKFRDTQGWKQGIGWFSVNHDTTAIKEWNRRST